MSASGRTERSSDPIGAPIADLVRNSSWNRCGGTSAVVCDKGVVGGYDRGVVVGKSVEVVELDDKGATRESHERMLATSQATGRKGMCLAAQTAVLSPLERLSEQCVQKWWVTALSLLDRARRYRPLNLLTHLREAPRGYGACPEETRPQCLISSATR